MAMVMLLATLSGAAHAADSFSSGIEAYKVGNYSTAAEAFADEGKVQPSVAAFHNLGNAEWQLGHVGPAILAWERAQSLGPWEAAPKYNLRFARHTAQIEAPRLRWHEAASTWLPMNAWAWVVAISFWLAASALVLPTALRWRRSVWYQAFAAGSFGVFLMTLPGLAGVQSRLGLVVVLESQTPLRLTPTREAQMFTRLAAGEVARVERERGDYTYVRLASDAAGWVEAGRLGRIAGN
jgi:hypothetical protein